MWLSDSSNRPANVLLGGLVLACLASAFLMVPVLTMVPEWPHLYAPLLLAIVGCVLAQGCFLAAWLAWSDEPFWRRLAWHWIVAAILYLVWTLGLAPREFSFEQTGADATE
jgi:NADH:ubiquinone oxidoreductase subunit 6 (subunit J)